jgi:hypothetical protein
MEGKMDLAPLVESMLYGIAVTKEPGKYADSKYTVSMDIEDNAANRWVLAANGVSHLDINGLCIQNIIHEVYVFEGASSQDEEVRHMVFRLLHGRDPGKPEDGWRWNLVREITQAMAAGQLHLLEIEPVCGAWVFLIAESVALQKMATP